MTNEANNIVKTIRQMEASLEDRQQQGAHRFDEQELKVTVPLIQCLQRLKEKQGRISKIHRERFEQVKSTCHVRTLRATLT